MKKATNTDKNYRLVEHNIARETIAKNLPCYKCKREFSIFECKCEIYNVEDGIPYPIWYGEKTCEYQLPKD